MKITSPVFSDNETLPSKYTCDADNISPPLGIADVPEDTKSLALIVDDPDAPSGTWTHWTLWNIDPTITKISENAVPNGAVEGLTGFGETGYGGPCPPSGSHRYFFKLYALDIILELDSSATVADLTSVMKGHIIDFAELIGLYSRE